MLHPAGPLRGIVYAVRHKADVINMSLAAPSTEADQTLAQAMEYVYLNDVLPVAAAGNSALDGNALPVPGCPDRRTARRHGVGLSVAAINPDGSAADFSTYNRYVSLAAPGVELRLQHGRAPRCRPPGPLGRHPGRRVSAAHPAQGSVRFAYGRGTSFSSPIAAGIAALTWQVEPRLASEQVADVLMRSAHQTVGKGWNGHTGTASSTVAPPRRSLAATTSSRRAARASARRSGRASRSASPARRTAASAGTSSPVT